MLTSLRRQTAEHQVLVVDNGSTDGTAGVLARYPEVESIRLDRNAGFGLAVNLAARGADGDSLVLVNDDCVCDDGFVERIVAPLGGGTAMSAGVLRDHVDPDLIDSAGMELSRTLMVFDYLHGQPLEALHSAPAPIGPSAAAAGFDRAAFLDEGGFDEALFAYWEDVDLVLRLRLGGGRCAFCPDARGTHAHSATLGSGSAAKNRLMGFGRGYVLRKWSVARGSRAMRVLAEEASLCAGQALIDGNAVGLSARVRGARAARPVFGYPGELLRSYDTPSLRGDLRRRLARRRRLRRRWEEPPREGLMRHLTPGRCLEPLGRLGVRRGVDGIAPGSDPGRARQRRSARRGCSRAAAQMAPASNCCWTSRRSRRRHGPPRGTTGVLVGAARDRAGERVDLDPSLAPPAGRPRGSTGGSGGARGRARTPPARRWKRRRNLT